MNKKKGASELIDRRESAAIALTKTPPIAAEHKAKFDLDGNPDESLVNAIMRLGSTELRPN